MTSGTDFALDKNSDWRIPPLFAAKTLPILEEHLQLARQLVQQQKVSQTR